MTVTGRRRGTVSFKYDPFGRRIYKSSSNGTSIYAYDGDNLVEETNSSGAVVARYSQTQNIDEPLAMLRSGATSYFHADGLGSVTSLSNGAGSLAQTYGYDSFGKQTSSSGSLTNPFQYTARESDTETGLFYYRARYYDPSGGRFISEDPLGFKASANFYAYVSNSPIDWIDPTGLFAELICEPISSMRGGWRNAVYLKISRAHHCFIHVKCKDYDVTIELTGPQEDPKHGKPHMEPFNPVSSNARRVASDQPRRTAWTCTIPSR
jgi:RHS repeat-associated protein